MIQANELRIGNWLYHTELCEHVQVESISSDQVTIKDHVVWEGDIGLIAGIPLTEEILVKCGFEIYAESCVSKGYSIGRNPVTNDYMLTLSW